MNFKVGYYYIGVDMLNYISIIAISIGKGSITL
jgi:hypothetical protein